MKHVLSEYFIDILLLLIAVIVAVVVFKFLISLVYQYYVKKKHLNQRNIEINVAEDVSVGTFSEGLEMQDDKSISNLYVDEVFEKINRNSLMDDLFKAIQLCYIVLIVSALYIVFLKYIYSSGGYISGRGKLVYILLVMTATFSLTLAFVFAVEYMQIAFKNRLKDLITTVSFYVVAITLLIDISQMIFWVYWILNKINYS